MPLALPHLACQGALVDFCSWCQTGGCLELPPQGPGPHTCGGKSPAQGGSWLEVELVCGAEREVGCHQLGLGGPEECRLGTLTWYGAGSGRWERILTKRGPLVEEMTNHSSSLAMRTP